MFNSKRSGIPVASTSSKSNIPTVKKTASVKEAAQSSPTRSKTTSSTRNSLSPVGRSSPPKQVSKMADLPSDPKALKTQIIDLQKKLDDREATLSELSNKLALKSEECADLMDEKDTIRKRTSIDLQQITKDYMELQEKFEEEQRKFVEKEKDYLEEKESLQLELDVSKGEHELELSMLRKEIIDIRNKSQQRGIPLDVETDRLKANYEDEIQSLKEQLQEQIAKNHDAMEKLDQNEFEILELNEMKKQYQRQIEVIAAEHETEIADIRRSYQSGKGDENAILDALRREHETSVNAIKKQHAIDLEKLQTEVNEQRTALEKQSTMGLGYEMRIKTLEAELQKSKNNADSKQDSFEELQSKHKEELEKLENLHQEEIQRVIVEHQTQDKDLNKNIELQQTQKRQIEAYDHEIRSLKAELKKERLDFTEAREMLENNLTELEQDMKAREEKVRWELKEEHKYELETLIEEHEQVLHDKDKAHKHELAEQKKNYEAKINASSNKEGTADQQNEANQKEIEDLKNKYENDIETLQETLENLQMEHEELQTEYDLVVNDLEGELEITKLKAKGRVDRRRSSGALKDGIGKLKSHNEEHVLHLTMELKEAQKIISSLNTEIATLKANEKTSLDNIDKVDKLEGLLKELEQGGHKQEEMLKELDEWKQSNEKLQNELNELSNFSQRLQTEADVLKQEKESGIADLENKIANVTKQCEQLENEKQKIEQQHAREDEKHENEVSKIRLEKEQELHSQETRYKEMIAELESSNTELQNENQILESENQRLQDEIDDLQVVSKSEPLIIANQSFSISAENVEMIGADVPEPSEELKRDQKMKAIVEDFENKIDDLQKQLTKANQEVTSKDKRLQSISVEMNVLQGSLDDERNMVLSLEDRCQKLLQNRDSEIEKMRKKYESGAEQSLSEHAEREAGIKNEYDNQLENLRIELKMSNEQNQKLLNDTKNLRSEVEMIGQQLIEQDAKYLAESIKQADEIQERRNEVEEEMDVLKHKLKTVTSTLNDERLEHERKEQETQFLVEQLKQSESDNTRIQEIVNELQKVQEENRTLRMEMTTKNDEFCKREEKLHKENTTKSSEIESLASMVDSERQGHKLKLVYFEKEIEKRNSELSSLSEMLEKEQANHEKTIHDTQKHIGKMTDLELRNDHVNRENTLLKNEIKDLQTKNEAMERETVKLKAKLRDLKSELSKRTQDNDDLLNRSKKIAIEEMEQVQQLNRSLTQSEIHKEKLLDEVENSKQVIQKTQEKYQKTKDKLKVVTEKWQKEHSKLEEILLSPRVDMGLQTSLIEPEELEDTKTQLSSSMKRNAKLEEELKDSKQGLNEFKNDIQAMKRANNVLIKQNQVLYLETEALKKTVETLTEKADQLRQISVKLTNENETLQHDNGDLKERLQAMELNLSQIEGERHSFDALNKSANSELEVQKTACQKYEHENSSLRDQNEFLLSQAKRLQTKVDELESNGKQLKNDLLAKEVELLKKGKELSEIQIRSVESKAMVPMTNPLRMQGLQQITSTGTDFNFNVLPTQEPEIKAKTDELSVESAAVPFGENGIDQGGSKGYVGLKSYQVIEWDTKQRKEPETQMTSTPLDSIQTAKIKQLEFDSSNYLGSAYWDTLNLLKNMKSSS